MIQGSSLKQILKKIKKKKIFCFNEKPKLYQTVNKNSYLSV